jgi:hypothetical protein
MTKPDSLRTSQKYRNSENGKYQEGLITMRKAKVFEAKNSRAVSLMKSWLRASGISFTTGAEPGVDLAVLDAAGRPVALQINCGESPPAAPGTVMVAGSVLTGRHLRDGLAFFTDFVAGLGYTPKTPVDRGELPEQKLSVVDDFEAVAMRHSELRRCPNPSTAQMKRYEPVLKKATWNFLRVNSRLCADNMLEFGDLFSYAQAWTINYLGLYEVPPEQDTANNNEKKLYYFLWQRYNEFRLLLLKKGRNIFPELDTASVAQHDRPYDHNNLASWNWADEQEEAVDEGYIARRRQLDVRTPNIRRASATRLLEQELGALPHDKLVTTLTEAVQNDRIHPDARREAARRLTEHCESCETCSGGFSEDLSALIGVDEEMTGIDSGGAQEQL